VNPHIARKGWWALRSAYEIIGGVAGAIEDDVFLGEETPP
jgi:hypothetical protein